MATPARSTSKPRRTDTEVAPQSDMALDMLAALKLALPYVEKVAATAPTEMMRQQRQRQACRDADVIRTAISKAEGK